MTPPVPNKIKQCPKVEEIKGSVSANIANMLMNASILSCYSKNQANQEKKKKKLYL